jgi:hypothetical protein
MKNSDNQLLKDLLSRGIKIEDINNAIRKSGYPLQNKVVNIIKKLIPNINEEEGYLDKKTKELRSIDISAQKPLWNYKEKQPRVRPELNLLIECKQSELPFIFFLSDNIKETPNFPIFAGLHSNNIEITTDDDASTWSFSINQILELHNNKFIRNDPIFCTTMSKCERKGKSIELSGSNSFNNLIFPIISAMDFFIHEEKPSKSAQYFDLHMVIGLGVLDAPMIGVKIYGNKHKIKPIHWVRIVRHHPDKYDYWENKENIFGIDIVHKDYLKEYLEKHLLPFADEYSKRVIRHTEVLASGKAFISGMEKDSWNNIEKRLKPRTIDKKLKRIKKIGNNIFPILKKSD